MGKSNRLVGKLPPTLAEPGFLHSTFIASCPSSSWSLPFPSSLEVDADNYNLSLNCTSLNLD